MERLEKILTGKTYIHYSNLSISQSCVSSCLLLLVSWELSRSFCMYVLSKKTTLIRCVCTFLLLRLLFVQYSKHLQDCQSSLLLWYRSIGSYSHRAIASESQEKGTNCRCIEILQNEDHHVIYAYTKSCSMLSCKVWDFFVYLIMYLSQICLIGFKRYVSYNWKHNNWKKCFFIKRW